MKKEFSLSLNGLQLKLIGWLYTLCSVAGIVFFPLESEGVVKVILSYLGYISLPIFAFLLVEGFAYSEHLERYILSLTIAAVVTEPFYDYYFTGSWLDVMSSNGQNILFALVLGLIQLYFLRYMGTGSVGRTISSTLMVLASVTWTFVLNIPNGFCVELMVGIFYLLHERERLRNWLAAALGLVLMGTPALGIPIITLYDGERGEYNKYIFYVLYPAIWIVAAVVKLLMA